MAGMMSLPVVVSTGEKIPSCVAKVCRMYSHFVDSMNQFHQMSALKEAQKQFKFRSAYDQQGLDYEGSQEDAQRWLEIEQLSKGFFQLDPQSQHERLLKIDEKVRATNWWKMYKAMVMSALSSASQDPSVKRILAVCLSGGPVTQVERRNMRKILEEYQHREEALGRQPTEVEIREITEWSEFLTLIQASRKRERPHLKIVLPSNSKIVLTGGEIVLEGPLEGGEGEARTKRQLRFPDTPLPKRQKTENAEEADVTDVPEDEGSHSGDEETSSSATSHSGDEEA